MWQQASASVSQPMRRALVGIAVCLVLYFEPLTTVVLSRQLQLAAKHPPHRCLIDPSTAPGTPDFRFDIVVTFPNGTGVGCHGDLRYLLRSLKTHGLWPLKVGTLWLVGAEVDFHTCEDLELPTYLRYSDPDDAHQTLPAIRSVWHSEFFLNQEDVGSGTNNPNAVDLGLPRIDGLGEWYIKFDASTVLVGVTL